jgi:hypothetical protein
VKIVTKPTVQVHPVPEHVTEPMGPFPPEMLKEPEIVYDYQPALSEDGGDYAPGATVQNNFTPTRYLRCGICMARVLETETESHVCGE